MAFVILSIHSSCYMNCCVQMWFIMHKYSRLQFLSIRQFQYWMSYPGPFGLRWCICLAVKAVTSSENCSATPHLYPSPVCLYFMWICMSCSYEPACLYFLLHVFTSCEPAFLTPYKPVWIGEGLSRYSTTNGRFYPRPSWDR